MNNEEKYYLHNGTDVIYKELWNKIYMDPLNHNYIKPIGGLWTIPYNSTYSEWIDYLERDRKDNYIRAIESKNLLVKIKDNSKILYINNKNDFDNLKDSNLIKILEKPAKILRYFDYIFISEIPDYEKIAKLYDAIYINPYADNSLCTFSVGTLLIINPDIISYYIPVTFTYNEFNEFSSITMENKKYINDLSDSYLKIVEVLKNEFIDFINNNNIDNIEYIYKLKEDFITYCLNNKKINNIIDNKINIVFALQTILNNIIVDLKDTVRLLKK